MDFPKSVCEIAIRNDTLSKSWCTEEKRKYSKKTKISLQCKTEGVHFEGPVILHCSQGSLMVFKQAAFNFLQQLPHSYMYMYI